MDVLLDNQTCETRAQTVGEAIDAAADLARTDGRLIVEIFVDGVRWDEAHMSSPEGIEAAAGEVRLVSADARVLVSQTLERAAEALDTAENMQREAAELLQAGEHLQSYPKLGEAISIWISVSEAIVKSAQVFGLSLDEITVGSTPLTASIQRLNEWLGVIRDALAARDQIGLADTLLYEFPEVTGEWKAVLAELSNRVDGSEPALLD